MQSAGSPEPSESSVRPFGFGVVVGGPDGRGATWSDTARRVEDSGYTALLIPDTLRTLSPFPALAAASAVTTSLELGTWVLAAPYRSPDALVREVRTLQSVSGGRLLLGIGAGRPGPDTERETVQLGGRWGTPRERVDMVQAALRAVVAQADPVPRVVVAGRGPRMLALAAESADIVALPLAPTATVDDVAAGATAVHSAAAGRARVPGLSLQLVGVAGVVPDWIRIQMRLDAAALAAAGSAALLTGDPTDMADQLQNLRTATGVTFVTVPGQLAEAFAPVVALLTGR